MLPNPVDKTAAPKAYAKAQANEVMTFRNFTQHIADHGGYSRGKVKGIVSDMCACLVEMLLQGKKVQLDELGDFWLSLTCEGAESCEAFRLTTSRESTSSSLPVWTSRTSSTRLSLRQWQAVPLRLLP